MAPSLYVYKLSSAGTTFLVGLAGVSLPWSLRSDERALSNGNMLSAGVMLGGGLLHLLPDAVEDLGEAWETEFPLAYLLFALGLLLPLVVEALLIGNDDHHHHHHHAAVRPPHNEEWAELNDLAGNSEPASEQPLCCETRRKPAGSSASSASGSGGGSTPEEVATPLYRGGPLRDVPLSSAVLFLGALSFHSVLEGLAQGAATSTEQALVMLAAIALHKGLAAFALGCLLLEAQLPRRTAMMLGVGFACMTPLGTLVGMAAVQVSDGDGEAGTLASALIAMAGGSFTFVSLLEVLPRELHGGGGRKATKVLLLLLGFGAMAALAEWL